MPIPFMNYCDLANLGHLYSPAQVRWPPKCPCAIPGSTHCKAMPLGSQSSQALTLGQADKPRHITDCFSSPIDPVKLLRPGTTPASPQYWPASILMHSRHPHSM